MKSGNPALPPLKSVKLLDQLRERIRYLHNSIRTEESYVYWVRAFIRFHGVRHPATMGHAEVEAFLSWLASERKVSASTHKQALSALLFFYSKVLCSDLPWMATTASLVIFWLSPCPFEECISPATRLLQRPG